MFLANWLTVLSRRRHGASVQLAAQNLADIYLPTPSVVSASLNTFERSTATASSSKRTSKARVNARLLIARSKHPGELRQSHAPLPSDEALTDNIPSASRTTRKRALHGRFVRHPTQVRSGPARSLLALVRRDDLRQCVDLNRRCVRTLHDTGGRIFLGPVR